MYSIMHMRVLYFAILFCVKNVSGLVTPPTYLNEEMESVCHDSDHKCVQWAMYGECQKNPAWMMANCKRSCHSCQGATSAWTLKEELSQSYDNSTEAMLKFLSTRLTVHSFYAGQFEIHESGNMIKMRGKMVLTWNDAQVKWDPQQWKLSWLTFYWPQIWTPEILQTNAPADVYLSKHTTELISANYTGQVYMWLNFFYTVIIDFDYKNFPNDKHEACYELDNKQYYATKFEFSEQAQKEVVSSAKKAHINGWLVKDVKINQKAGRIKIVEDWNKDPFIIDRSSVEICIIFKRDSSYANLQTTAPLIIPALVTLASFLTGDFKRQMYVLIGSLGLQLVALYPLHQVLPPDSGETPIALKFFTFNAYMTCLILVAAVALYALSASKSQIPPPHFVSIFVDLMQKYTSCCWFSNISNENPNGVNPESGGAAKLESNNDVAKSNGTLSGAGTGRYQWPVLANALKCTLMILCLTFYFIALLVCFVF